MVTPSRRPITEEERPYLEALGDEVRALRLAARPTRHELAARAIPANGRLPHAYRVTQRVLANRAQMSASHVSTIERGLRRTRRSTLERIVRALVDDDLVAEVLDGLVEIAGPALAPEAAEAYVQRIIARRERRTERHRARELQLLRQSVRTLRQVGTDGEIGRRVQAMIEKLEGDIARVQAEVLPPTKSAPAPAPQPAHRPSILEQLRERTGESPAVLDGSRRSGRVR